MKNCDHKQEWLDLNKLRKENVTCDVTIQIDQQNFSAHRAPLMAELEFFRNMFSSDTKENKTNIVKFDSNIVPSEVFEDFLNFVYESEIEFTDENASKICVAASFFCYDKLLKKAVNYLVSNLKPSNVAEIHDFALRTCIKTLEQECEKFICKNSLFEIIKSDLLPCWTFEDLLRVLRRFNSKFEELFLIIVEWAQLDESGRRLKLPSLFINVPIEKLDYKFLQKFYSEQKTWFKRMGCLGIIEDTLEIIYKKEIIYFFDKSHREALSEVSKYDSIQKLWEEITPLCRTPILMGCTTIKDKIYMAGGVRDYKILNDFQVFHTKTETFQKLKPMKYERSGCEMAELNNFIYVAGGNGGGGYYRSFVERYNIDMDEWDEIAPMKEKRYMFGFFSLNGKLYAVGGESYNWDDPQNTVECYDPRKNKWTFKANMHKIKGMCCAVVYNNKIYAVQKKNFEVYDPESNTWTILPEPNTDYESDSRSFVVFNDKLMLLGKKDGYQVADVEYFDIKKNLWIQTESMCIRTCYDTVSVVKFQDIIEE